MSGQQHNEIRSMILSCLDDGVSNKEDIYTRVVDTLGVPRPTVRRVTSSLRVELQNKLDVLNSSKPRALDTVRIEA